MEEKSKSFEESLTRLDEIVKLLERGDAPLEGSLKLFEEGTMLVEKCGKMLEDAEQTVVRLKKGDSGQPQELPFAESE